MNKTYIFILAGFILTFNAKSQTQLNNFDRYKNSEKTNIVPDFINLRKLRKSIELVENYHLIGDFNGDGKSDFASVIIDQSNGKKGVLIIHNSNNQEKFIFGAGKKIDNMTDLNWIEIFKTIPKGKLVAPELVDKKTGDLLGPDKNQMFKLIGDGIYMSVTETHGGGIIFWNGKKYKWFHIE